MRMNLRGEIENQAPNFGMPAELEAGFARTPLGGETLGLSRMTLAPGFRIPFGHKQPGQEVYVVVRSSGRIKVEDEIVELAEWDAVRVDKDTMQNIEAGPDRARISSPSAPPTTRSTRRWRRLVVGVIRVREHT